jgi:hypothetical protein
MASALKLRPWETEEIGEIELAGNTRNEIATQLAEAKLAPQMV